LTNNSITKPEDFSKSNLAGFVPTSLLVVQPSPFCNINCSYCYLADRSNKKRMTAETVQAIVRFLTDVPFADDSLTVCWHAGEPLAVPISFYEEAFEIFASGPRQVRQNIQTNGTLITDEWCLLFKKWSVQIGLSIDGPKTTHDLHRVDRSGRGTFDRVARGMSKLHKHEIPFSVIAVLTRDSLQAADELWEFFKSAGISAVGFNIDETEGIHGKSSLNDKEHLTAFRRFMFRIAELHERNGDVEVREIENMRRHLTAQPGAEVERADNRPGAILNIDVDGNLTTFSPELLGQKHPKYGRFNWGNVHTDSWATIMQNLSFQQVCADIKAGIDLCHQSCQYFSVCGGGAPSNKLAELGTFISTETQYCRFRVQAVADVVIERLEREIELGRLRNVAAQ
jgi:uncharacterized protein